jgi:hypothetical protein
MKKIMLSVLSCAILLIGSFACADQDKNPWGTPPTPEEIAQIEQEINKIAHPHMRALDLLCLYIVSGRHDSLENVINSDEIKQLQALPDEKLRAILFLHILRAEVDNLCQKYARYCKDFSPPLMGMEMSFAFIKHRSLFQHVDMATLLYPGLNPESTPLNTDIERHFEKEIGSESNKKTYEETLKELTEKLNALLEQSINQALQAK